MPSSKVDNGSRHNKRPDVLRSIWAFLSGPYPTLVSRLGLGLIFLLSGLTKLGVATAFQSSIGVVSDALALLAPCHGGRPASTGAGPRGVARAGAIHPLIGSDLGGLLVIFLIAMIQAVFRGLDPSCGCFLGGAQDNPIGLAAIHALGPIGIWLTEEKVGIGSIARDGVFLLMSINLLLVPTVFALDNLRNRGQGPGVGDQEEEFEDEDEAPLTLGDPNL